MADDIISLTTPQAVKNYLNITDENSDTAIADLIARISKEIEVYCNRNFKKETRIDYFSGDGQMSIRLKNYPIIEITSIHDDYDRAYGSDTLIDAGDYTFEPEEGIVYFEAPLTKGIRNVKVTYVAGYETIPQDLELAAILDVVAAFSETKILVAIQEGQESSSFKISDLQKRANVIKDRYRRYANG